MRAFYIEFTITDGEHEYTEKMYFLSPSEASLEEIGHERMTEIYFSEYLETPDTKIKECSKKAYWLPCFMRSIMVSKIKEIPIRDYNKLQFLFRKILG
ncbi:hypothetical protein [Persicobacter diffluens]|uniref:Uncharacterized protein n=1 Tax=Persicobacter diffluens TaxID=981 RepID=A0AAN5ANA2_9BACT|nr:hypothetical protein PEDI_51540 [Persicobacter diffluens]